MGTKGGRAKQLDTDMEYLMHVLRNGTTKIEGCLGELESFCRDMRTALEGFKSCLLKEDNGGNGS
jgi:hypothetical protein